MAVNLTTLVDPLIREVSPPGTDAFPAADYTGMLSDAFWEIRLFGFIPTFEENAAARGGPAEWTAGIVTPLGAVFGYDDPDGYSSTDLGRDLQQLIVLWAAYKTALIQMQSLNSVFRTKAGPVEYETQQSASVLKGVLDALRERIDFITKALSAYGMGGATVVLDQVIDRSYAQAAGDVWWVR